MIFVTQVVPTGLHIPEMRFPPVSSHCHCFSFDLSTYVDGSEALPSLCPVHVVRKSCNGSTYLIMEKLEASSGILFERVKPGRVIFTSVLELTAQVKKLHECLHSQQGCH